MAVRALARIAAAPVKLVALSCCLVALCSQAGQAQSAKLAKPVPEWGVNAAIESDLLKSNKRATKNNNPTPGKKQRVLLVGNSYTNFNLLHMLIERLAEAGGGPRLQVEVEARAGYSLRMHLKSRTVLSKIKNGHFSHVVLQGHSLSAVDRPDELSQDAERLTAAIEAAGSRAIMYETWARKPHSSLYKKHARVKTFEDMFTQINSAYLGIARRLGVGLAPVGTAFERAWRENPSVPLWGSDGSHPTLAGSYMAACVLYGTITGRDPREAAWEPYPLDRKLAELIRSVAADSISGLPAVRDVYVPSQAVAVENKAGRKGDSAKLNRGDSKTPAAGQVAASIAAFMGRAPGQLDEPDTAPTADEEDAPADGVAPTAPTSADEDAPMLPVPVRERALQPEKASFVGDAPAHETHANVDMPLVAF